MTQPEEPVDVGPADAGNPTDDSGASAPSPAPSAEASTPDDAPPSADRTPDGGPQDGGEQPQQEGASEKEGGGAEGGEGGRKKRRRKKKPATAHAGGGGGGGGGGGAPHGGGRTFVEDQIDRDADHLARDARSIPSSRLRPLAIMAQEVRRMMASGEPIDAREARRALILMKSKIAYLAGREQGRERSAFVKVRDVVFRGVDTITRNRETPDPLQLRNFLDHVEAFVGYHRFHSDDRRRD